MLWTALEKLGTFSHYKELALIGHSMGGLVIQRALLDGAFLQRVSHVILFGTPSGGLKKAGLGRLFKRQARDMDRDGAFVKLLRLDWNTRIGKNPPFHFTVVAGVRDEFVPRDSSVDVFEPQYRAIVNGNHLEIVKPEFADTDSVELLLNLLTKSSASLTTVQTQMLQRIDSFSAKRDNLSENDAEELAYALEATGQQAEAIEVLEKFPNRGTNLTGVLAGLLKRRWLADPAVYAADGPRAHEYYFEAYAKAGSAKKHAQAFYNGINVAFMTLALGKDAEGARTVAAEVLSHTFLAKDEAWARVTQAEAYLYVGDTGAAKLAYAEALKQEWTPRQLDSIKRQALWAARLIDDEETEAELQRLFENLQ